ncbi:hypothetical protein BC567DRAFT_77035 [Phyllosticta citribraziliensis]
MRPLDDVSNRRISQRRPGSGALVHNFRWKDDFSLSRLQCADERLLNTEPTQDGRVSPWLGAFVVRVYSDAIEQVQHGLGTRQTSSLLSVSNKLLRGAMPGDHTMSAERPAPSASRPHSAHPMNLRRGCRCSPLFSACRYCSPHEQCDDRKDQRVLSNSDTSCDEHP